MNVVLLLSCALLITTVSGDLADEAKEALEELRSIVQGDITVAHDNLESIHADFVEHAKDIEETETLSFEEIRHRYHQEIELLNDLAWAAGKDPTDCSGMRAQAIDNMFDFYKNASDACIEYQSAEEKKLVGDARYTIDVSINKIYNLDFQLNRCAGEILCVSPIVNEIALDKVRLPENIKTEVQAAERFVSLIKGKVKDCSDAEILQYGDQGMMIVLAITYCINNLITGDA